MRVLTATFYIDDGAPLEPGITTELDGQRQATHGGLEPEAWIAALDAIGTASGADLRSDVAGRLDQVIDLLRASVDEGRRLQETREQALAAWENVPAPTISVRTGY